MSNKLTRSEWEAGYLIFQDSDRNDIAGFQSGGFQVFKTPVVAKAASYSVLAADSGTVFTTTGATGAVTFTLPTVAAGLHYTFVNTVDQNMVISATGKIVYLNDLTADTLTFSTATELIGAIVQVWSDGTKWLVGVPCANTVTVGT